MPTDCEICKANPVDIAKSTPGTPTAKLIAILEAHGITSASELAEIIGISDRAVRKSRNSGSGTEVPTGTTGPELQDRGGTQVPKTELQDRNSGSAPSRAHATKESLRDTYTYEFSKIPPTPQTRAEDVRFAHGRLEVGGRFEKFWLNEFGGDEDRLRLALIEIGGRIQPHGSRPLEAQVSSQLARIAADKRDRDKRYQAAAQVNRQAAPKRLDMSKFVLVDCEPVS